MPIFDTSINNGINQKQTSTFIVAAHAQMGSFPFCCVKLLTIHFVLFPIDCWHLLPSALPLSGKMANSSNDAKNRNSDQLLPMVWMMVHYRVAFEQSIRTRKMDICAVTFYNRIYNFWWKRSRCEWICVAYLLRIHASVEIPFSTKLFCKRSNVNYADEPNERCFARSAVQGSASPIKIEVLCESEKATT